MMNVKLIAGVAAVGAVAVGGVVVSKMIKSKKGNEIIDDNTSDVQSSGEFDKAFESIISDDFDDVFEIEKEDETEAEQVEGTHELVKEKVTEEPKTSKRTAAVFNNESSRFLAKMIHSESIMFNRLYDRKSGITFGCLDDQRYILANAASTIIQGNIMDTPINSDISNDSIKVINLYYKMNGLLWSDSSNDELIKLLDEWEKATIEFCKKYPDEFAFAKEKWIQQVYHSGEMMKKGYVRPDVEYENIMNEIDKSEDEEGDNIQDDEENNN